MKTESENIDNVSMDTDNVTVTNDIAFERVTSDIKMEEENDGGYLKQNTAGLVQEVPNISFLDIADTMLESQKTLHNRKNWNVVVGKAGKSIETIPQDFGKMIYNDDRYDATDYSFDVPLDTLITTDSEGNLSTYEKSGNKIKILIPGVYRVAYGWTANISSARDFDIGVYLNNTFVMHDRYVSSNTLGFIRFSGGKSTFIQCDAGDTISLHVETDYNGISIYGYDETYLELQYVQQSI